MGKRSFAGGLLDDIPRVPGCSDLMEAGISMVWCMVGHELHLVVTIIFFFKLRNNSPLESFWNMFLLGYSNYFISSFCNKVSFGRGDSFCVR